MRAMKEEHLEGEETSPKIREKKRILCQNRKMHNHSGLKKIRRMVELR